MSKKIRIPIHLCRDGMKLAGEKVKSYKWTDEELACQITALNLTIAYLDARGDSKIVVNQLRMDLDSFLSYKNAREND